MIAIRLSEPKWSESLARFLEERSYIVERRRDRFEVYPLASLHHELIAPHVAAQLQRWASSHPDAVVSIDGRPKGRLDAATC